MFSLSFEGFLSVRVASWRPCGARGTRETHSYSLESHHFSSTRRSVIGNTNNHESFEAQGRRATWMAAILCAFLKVAVKLLPLIAKRFCFEVFAIQVDGNIWKERKGKLHSQPPALFFSLLALPMGLVGSPGGQVLVSFLFFIFLLSLSCWWISFFVSLQMSARLWRTMERDSWSQSSSLTESLVWYNTLEPLPVQVHTNKGEILCCRVLHEAKWKK